MSCRLCGLEDHVKQNLPLVEEINNFKLNEIKRALMNSKLSIVDAAESLKIDFADLVSIINGEFPCLYEELGIQKPVIEKAKIQSTKICREIMPLNNIKDDLNFSNAFSP